MSDNAAVLAGYRRELIATSDRCDLHLLVRDGVNLDSRFIAWDMDEQEFIAVNGWLFLFSEVAS